jgi:hypothetical protein
LGSLKSKKNLKVPLLLPKGEKGEGRAPLGSWILLTSFCHPFLPSLIGYITESSRKVVAYVEGTLRRAWMKKNSSMKCMVF